MTYRPSSATWECGRCGEEVSGPDDLYSVVDGDEDGDDGICDACWAQAERTGEVSSARIGDETRTAADARSFTVDLTPEWADLARLAVRMARDYRTDEDEVRSMALTLLVSWCRDPPSLDDVDVFASMVVV